MYDDRQKWSRLGSVAGQKTVEYLLDFSRGPNSALVTDFKKPTECDASVRTSAFSDFRVESTPSPNGETPEAMDTSSRGKVTEGKPRAVCSFCSKTFMHLGDHNKHRRRHTGERPYGCDLCPLRFAHASNLARHRRLHSGEKPFTCAGCGRGFARKDKLNAHVARRRCGAETPAKPDGEARRVTGPSED